MTIPRFVFADQGQKKSPFGVGATTCIKNPFLHRFVVGMPADKPLRTLHRGSDALQIPGKIVCYIHGIG